MGPLPILFMTPAGQGHQHHALAPWLIKHRQKLDGPAMHCRMIDGDPRSAIISSKLHKLSGYVTYQRTPGCTRGDSAKASTRWLLPASALSSSSDSFL